MKTSLMFLLIVAGCGGGSAKIAYDPDASIDGACPSPQPASGDSCDFGTKLCYYFDACTGDGTGVIASCQDGHVTLGYDQPLRLCPSLPPQEGDACPCGVGGRQQSPCDYQCTEGGTRRLSCDGSATWKVVSGPTACTPEPGDFGI